MAPAKKVATSKAPKKASSKSTTSSHPPWTDMIKVLTISMVYSVSLPLVTGAFSVLTELNVVVFSILFLKRGRLDSGHCRAAFSLARALLPHAASALPASTVVSSPPFVYENHVCVKTDYYIAHAGMHCRQSRGCAPWSLSPTNQEVRSYFM
jgi:hypothetical protein